MFRKHCKNDTVSSVVVCVLPCYLIRARGRMMKEKGIKEALHIRVSERGEES